MARVLQEYHFHGLSDAKYPWDTWFDGRIFKLREGVDFRCTLGSLVSLAYNNAKRRGIKVRVSKRVRTGTVVLQAQLPASQAPQSFLRKYGRKAAEKRRREREWCPVPSGVEVVRACFGCHGEIGVLLLHYENLHVDDRYMCVRCFKVLGNEDAEIG